MTKFISVLNSSLDLSYWEAVQWGNSLESVKSNPLYSSNASLSIIKNSNDILLEEKQITEAATNKKAKATIIKVDLQSTNFLKLANNKASVTFIKKIKL